MFVREGEHCWFVEVGQIRLLESEGNYTRVHFGDAQPQLFRSLNAMEERLDPKYFFRANRRQIINIAWIDRHRALVQQRPPRPAQGRGEGRAQPQAGPGIPRADELVTAGSQAYPGDDRGAAPHEGLPRQEEGGDPRGRRRLLQGGARQHLRAPGRERRGKDDDAPPAGDAAQSRQAARPPSRASTSRREPDKVRANVGFLAASTALYARLTAREMIAYFGRLNGLGEPRLRGAIRTLADELDMHEFLDRRCDKLSTGMKQKTSIARTLVHDPQVMIFDEPTLGLDVIASRAIVRFVRECRARGKTVIYSTHVMSEAEKLCDVIGIIHGGPAAGRGHPRRAAREDRRDGPRGGLRQDHQPGGQRMNGRNIGTIYAKELRDTLRDRRTLVSTIVMPTLLMPLLIFGIGDHGLQGRHQGPGGDPARSWSMGGADSPGVRAELEKSGKFRVEAASGRLEGAHLGQEGPRGGRDPGRDSRRRLGGGSAPPSPSTTTRASSSRGWPWSSWRLLLGAARPHDDPAARRPRPARLDRPALRGEPDERRAAGEGRGQLPRRHHPLLHHHPLPHRRHVPGDGPRPPARRSGARWRPCCAARRPARTSSSGSS